MASSPTECMVPSMNALEHNYISVRVHAPQEKAKLSNSFLHSKLWSHRVQLENKSHSGKERHIKNTRCSFQIRGVVGLHSFPLQNAIFKKRTEDPVCVTLQT